MTRAATAVRRARRLPCRAGMRAARVTTPSAATSRLMPSGGAIEEPITPSRAMSMTPSTAKMTAGAAGRTAERVVIRDAVVMSILLSEVMS